MANIITSLDAFDVVNKYKNGMSITAIARCFNCSISPIRTCLINHGIERRTGSDYTRKNIDIDSLISHYRDGLSVLALSKIFNVDRGTIVSRLKENHLTIRNAIEAGFIRMSKLSDIERKNLTKNANIASKGRRVGEYEKHFCAKVRQENISHVGYGENEVRHWCKERGLDLIPQLAVSRYNIDLAKFPLAIEIKIGTNFPHRSNKTDKKKIKYLLNNGWSIIYVLVRHKELIIESHSDYIVTYFDSIRLDPSLIGEYRMLGRNAELKACLRLNGDDLS